MCTLPGRTYYAVRNTGKNFAVAIITNSRMHPISRWSTDGAPKVELNAVLQPLPWKTSKGPLWYHPILLHLSTQLLFYKKN